MTDNENLKRILDYLKISYWLVGIDFVLIDVNETFLTLTGAKRTKLIGRKMLTLINEVERKKVKQAVTGLIEHKKQSVQFEMYVYGKDGKEKIPVLIHLSLNTDPDGIARTANVLLVDISEQKKIRDALEKEKKMLQTILFGIRDCVSVFDEQGRFQFGNITASKLHAHRQTSLLPSVSDKPVRLEIMLEGQKRQFMGELYPINDQDNQLFGYVETLTDITDNIQLEEKEKELFHFRRQMRRKSIESKMIGSGQKMENVFETILRCAEVDSSVLLMGETGVGKEMAARAIHHQSHRKNNPFVCVNCGALPENLLESELFGHIKGAFTGAISNRAGLFREAHTGTLFLDEIGELNKSMQVKLLRVLQEHEVRPVGSDQIFHVDVRIICATNRNLYEFTQSQQFRQDLYYRIAVITLTIPPLRERSQDIYKLANHFINKHQKKGRRHLKKLNMASQQMLMNYPWPGNIRELENAIEHAIAMCQGQDITPDCFPPHILYPLERSQPAQDHDNLIQSGQKLKHARDRQMIEDALIRHGGNQTAAAKELGISRVTLWRRKTMYNIKVPAPY